jgi:hypothetical protein
VYSPHPHQLLNAWTNLYENWYVYHETWTHINSLLHKSLPPVCVSAYSICPLLFLGKGSEKCIPPSLLGNGNNRSTVGRVVFYAVCVFFLICIVGGGVQTGSIGTSATYWPIVPAPGDCEDGEFGGMNGRGNRSPRRKPAPAPLCPPQIPLDETRVGSQRLTASAMARPSLCLTKGEAVGLSAYRAIVATWQLRKDAPVATKNFRRCRFLYGWCIKDWNKHVASCLVFILLLMIISFVVSNITKTVNETFKFIKQCSLFWNE